eukprot:6956313-Pyramimonas_sp.AAC.1
MLHVPAADTPAHRIARAAYMRAVQVSTYSIQACLTLVGRRTASLKYSLLRPRASRKQGSGPRAMLRSPLFQTGACGAAFFYRHQKDILRDIHLRTPTRKSAVLQPR